MKRRNVDLSKLRRPMKSKKISEGVYTSLFGYIKFLAVWGLVLLADFILEFRFEYLYPVWLLIRTVQDSYKYQGTLLTMLFLAIAIGADLFCYVFIPVQWLFFAASSYVWVQYVWHTDKGICLSSISLWLLFVYVEAALRMKDQKVLPFNMDLCRPFAAHCIGYPVVTLGYGIKTAAHESLRRRTRNKVKKSNQFYADLLQEALPLELREPNRLANDLRTDLDQPKSKDDNISDTSSEASEHIGVKSENTNNIVNGGTNHTLSTNNSGSKDLSNQSKSSYIEDYVVTTENETRELRRRNINDLNEEAENMLNDSKNKVSKDPVPKKLNNKRNKNSGNNTVTANSNTSSTAHTTSNGHAVTANGDINCAPDFVSRLESDVKRLKADLQSSRNTESELRAQLSNKTNEERQKKATLAQLQQDNDNLQNKLHNLVMSKQQDKQTLASLEKKYLDEKKLREKSEQQLVSERKAKKQEDQVAAKALALANAGRNADCVGNCKTRLKDMEESINKYKWDVERKDEQLRQLEHDAQLLRKYKETNTDNNEVLMSALAAMQDKTAHLENSLSAETKIKMELFSALGDVRRKIEMQHREILAKNKEIEALRSHIAEALALVPSSMYTDQPLASGQYTTPKLGSPMMINCGQAYMPGLPPPHEMMYNPHCMSMTPPPISSIPVQPDRCSPSTPQGGLPGSVSPPSTPVSENDVTVNTNGLNTHAQDYQTSQSN